MEWTKDEKVSCCFTSGKDFSGVPSRNAYKLFKVVKNKTPFIFPPGHILTSHNIQELMLSYCGAREDSWESLGQQRRSNQSILKDWLNIHYKDLYWSSSSSTLATWCEEPIHWKRLRCWERLKAKGEEGDKGWDGWMESLTQWKWVWASSRKQWRTGKPGVLQFMGS